jgi:phosphopantetheinyl transferase
LPRPEVVAVAARDEELALAGGPPALAFARVWTAKEAVLKLAGCGLGELSRVRIEARPARDALLVRHRGRACRVALFEVQGHVAALVLEDEALEPRFVLEALAEARA